MTTAMIMDMEENGQSDETLLWCDRCATELRSGAGDFYVVKIEAVADPAPPVFSEDDLQRNHAKEIERLFSQIEDMSEQELVDQVYRRLTLYLCGPCYRQWIEDPVG